MVIRINSNDSVSNKIQRVEELQVDPDDSEPENIPMPDDTTPENGIEVANEEVKVEEPKVEESEKENEEKGLEDISKGGVIEGSASSNCGFPDLNDSDGDQAPHELLSK
jgi:hypothetical protein